MSTQVTVEENGKIYSIPLEIFGDLTPEDEEFKIRAKQYLLGTNQDYFEDHASPEDLFRQKNIQEAASRLKQISPVYAPIIPSTIQSRMGVGAYTSERQGVSRFPRIVKESAYANSEFTPKQDMATVLGVPEANLDVQSGASPVLRNFAGFYTNPRQVKSFYEKNTGAKYIKLNIDGSEQPFLKYPDGTALKVDEVGFGLTDIFEFAAPEIAPVGANIAVTTTLVASDPTKSLSLLYGPAAGAATETAVREAQAGLFQITPYFVGLKPPDLEFDLPEFAVRAGTEVLVNSTIDIATGGFGSMVIKTAPFKVSTKVLDDGAEAALESGKQLNKEMGEEAVTAMPLSPEALQRLARSNELVNSVLKDIQKKTQNRFFEIIGAGKKAPDASKKLIQDAVIGYVEKKRSYLSDLEKQIREISNDAGDAFVKNTEDSIEAMVRSYGNGSYRTNEILANNRTKILGIFDSAGKRIKKQNDANYANVFKAARAEGVPIKVSIKEIVDAITGSTRKGSQSRLSDKKANAYVETLFESLGYAKHKYKTLDELKKSGLKLDEFLVSFEDLDNFYKNSKSTFGTLLQPSDRTTALAEERIRKLRFQSIKGTETKRLLDEADNYFVNYHQAMYGKKGLAQKGIDDKNLIPKDGIYQNLLPKERQFVIIENLKTAKRLLNPEEYMAYKDSLAIPFLNEYGWFDTGVSNSFFGKQTREVAEEIFGEQSEKIYNLARDMKQSKIKLSEADLDEIIKENKISPLGGAYLTSQKVRIAKRLAETEDVLSKSLFSLDDGKKAMLEDKSLAARHTNSDGVSSEMVEDFMMSMKGKDTLKLSYQTEVLSDLIGRVGKSQTSKSFFDASPVLEKMKRFEKKYKQIFGDKQYNQILANLKYAKSIEGDVNSFYKNVDQQTTSVARTSTASSGNQQLSFAFLNYIRPSVIKRSIQDKIMAMAIIDGDFKGLFNIRQKANPEFRYEDSKALSRALTKYITSEKWASVVLGHDDYLAMYALETLGLQGFMSSQNNSLVKDIRRETAMQSKSQKRFPDIKK